MFYSLGQCYAWLQELRSRAYERGRLQTWRPPVPCISVGNVNWGGRGKTPLAEWLLHWSLDQGLQPVLLTRGYRASPPYFPFVVSPDSPVRQAGDEPLLLARSCPQARVVVDPRRVRSAAWAWKHFKPDIYILDDGFQHLALERDIDLVLLNMHDLSEGWNRVIPAGSWREGQQALARASAFVLSAPDQRLLPDLLSQGQKRLVRFQRPVFAFYLKARGLVRVSDGRFLAEPSGRPYLLFSALANPRAFYRTACSFFGYPPRAELIFPDHHFFTEQDWMRIRERWHALGRPLLLCTAKDAVKLTHLLAPEAEISLPGQAPEVVCLQVSVCFGQGLPDFKAWLRRQVSGLAS